MASSPRTNTTERARRGAWGASGLAATGALVAALVVAAPAHANGVAVKKPTTPGFLGVASVAGKPLVGARVTVYASPSTGRWFTKRLATAKPVRTNKRGGFTAGVKGLPTSYAIRVSGGTVGGRAFRSHLFALANAKERGVVVNPVTTVAAAYSRKHPRMSTAAASRDVRRLLGVPRLTGGTMALGEATGVESKAFSPSRFMAAATRKGGLSALAGSLARIAANPKARVTYRDPEYAPRTTVRRAGTRTSGAPTAHAASSVASSVLTKMLANVIYAESCQLVGPSLPSFMTCGGGGSSSGLASAIDALETSVADIQATLTEMESQLQAVVSQGDQQAYEDAYAFAGVNPVNTAVQSASSDLNLLDAAYPDGATAVAPNANATSFSQQCAAVYPNLYTNNSDPYDVCVDFMTQASSFSATSTDYFASMYEALTGASNQPQDNLLTYTYQQALIGGTDATLVPQSTLAAIQDDLGQIVQLQANAFALLGSAQSFAFMVNAGEQPSCPDTTVTGTFPASTPINVADACAVAETALFEASVETDLSADVAVPPPGAVSDARTNNVWWGYPVDLSGVTLSSGTYPYYPGSTAGGYATSGGLIALASSTTGLPILSAYPDYAFLFADSTHAQQILKGLPVPSGSTPNAVLNGLGFVGLGTNAYGLNWANFGVGVNANGYSTTNPWNVNTHEVFMDCAQGSYLNVSGMFQCSAIYVNADYSENVPGVVVKAPLATAYYGLNGSTSPTSTSSCPGITYASTATTGTPHVDGTVPYCTANTYGLLVDNQAPSPGAASNGIAPPFWSLNMLVGPTGNVPAVAVPAPS